MTTTNQTTDRATLADAIFKVVQHLDWVSFAELPRRLADAGVNADDLRGEHTLELAGNVILWAGLSAELVDTLCGLLSEKRVFLHQATVLTYMVDGGTLTLPLAKCPPPAGYTRPHWLPACLRLVPMKPAKPRRAGQ